MTFVYADRRRQDLSFEDIGILKRLWENAERRVEDVQGRAVSWVQLVPAVTALLYSAFAILNPGNGEDIASGYKIMLFSLATAAFLALGWATYQFYVAAYGDPTLDHGPFAVEP